MNFCQLALSVIELEAEAIHALADRLNEKFNEACRLLMQCKGRVVVFGVGKSGHIANKIAATLASTGTPAFFVHPSEAGHGDMGMVTEQDVILLLSNSGHTEEILSLLPLFKRLSLPIVALVGRLDSPLGCHATVALDVSVSQEACPLGLAPTASTTAALAMGDAIAIALLEARGFSEADFARAHPKGLLGRKLLLQLSDVMHTGDAIPKVNKKAPIRETIFEMTSKKLGFTTVIDSQDNLCGIITDGDLRRTFEMNCDMNQTTAEEIMNSKVKTFSKEELASDALQYMHEHKITALVIKSKASQQIAGVIHIHDLLKVGV